MNFVKLKKSQSISKRRRTLRSRSPALGIYSDSEISQDEEMNLKVLPQVPYFEMVLDDDQNNSRKKKDLKERSVEDSAKAVTSNKSIPVNPIETIGEKMDVPEIQFCHACLSSNQSVCIVRGGLRDTYRKLCGAGDNCRQTCGANKTSQELELCAFCHRLLHNAHKFASRCRVADGLVQKLYNNSQVSGITNITIADIEKTKREHNISATNLTLSQLKPDFYNNEYIFEENVPEIVKENVSDKIKQEVGPLSPEDFADNECNDPIEIIDEPPIPKLKRKLTPKSKHLKVKINKTRKNIKAKQINDENKEIKKRKKAKDKIKTEVQKKMDEYFTVTIFKTIDEKIEELQKRKENSSYINAPLKCEFCYQGYLDSETYDLHMHKHTDNYGGFTCVVCQYRCPSKERLRQHLYFRHSRKFNCKVCRFESHDKYRATLHMKFHEGKTYKCKHCEKVFNHVVNLHNHLRAKHPSDNVCDLCGYSFIGERGLKTHRSLTHGHDLRADNSLIPEDAPSCKECVVRFISEEALQMHLKVSPKHGKSIENFKKRNYHQLHRSIKSGAKSVKDTKTITRKRDGIRVEKREIRLTKFDEPVPCEKCGLNIASASEYHYHFKRSHPNEHRTWYPTDTHPHLCDICGKMLRMNALKDHMLEHQEGVTFKCDTCGKGFSKRFNMKLHARVHLGERYPCAVCGKLFNHMGNRDRHLKYVHTELKDFKCEFCGKCFKNDGARKLHTNHVHLRKPYPKRNRNREGQVESKRRQKAIEDEPSFEREIWE